MILGGKKIIYYDCVPPSAQSRVKGKSSRTEKKLKKLGLQSLGSADVSKLKGKEEERMWKKKKVQGWVEWPWSEVSAWCRIANEGDQGNKFLVGDAFGRLAMVSVDISEDGKITLLALGEVRCCVYFGILI